MSKINNLLLTRSQPTSEKSYQSEGDKAQQKMRLISCILRRIFAKTFSIAFYRIRIIPARTATLRDRFPKVLGAFFRRQDYTQKWGSFQRLRQASLQSQSRELAYIEKSLGNLRSSAMRLLIAWVQGKRKFNFNWTIKRIRTFGDWRQSERNGQLRTGFRKISGIFWRKFRQSFVSIRESRVNELRALHCKGVVRVLRGVMGRNLRGSFVRLRRGMLNSRKQRLGEQIKELDQKLNGGEDEQIKELKVRQEELMGQLDEVRKQREEITQGLERELREAEARKQQMESRVQGLKKRQLQLHQRVKILEEELRRGFSMDQVFQMCFNNLVSLVVTKGEKGLVKEELLRSLQVPLLPIDVPIGPLKEENQVLGELVTQYIVMYGQKREQGRLEVPYQYLVKENQFLYRIATCVLPEVKTAGEQLQKLKDCIQDIEKTLKANGYK